MKRLILSLALVLAGISASAQSGWFTFDAGRGTLLNDANYPYKTYGITLAKSFDIDYPSPWFLDTGFSTYWVGLDDNYTYGVSFEVPVSMELRLDPFWWMQLGLHAGGYGTASVGTDQLKTLRGGVMAGVNLYFFRFFVGARYMYDFTPFDVNGFKSKGLRLSLGFNFN